MTIQHIQKKQIINGGKKDTFISKVSIQRKIHQSPNTGEISKKMKIKFM